MTQIWLSCSLPEIDGHADEVVLVARADNPHHHFRLQSGQLDLFDEAIGLSIECERDPAHVTTVHQLPGGVTSTVAPPVNGRRRRATDGTKA